MAKTINAVIDALPAKNLTTRILGCIDWVVPGQYQNLTGFTNTVKAITGETDEDFVQKVGERAIALYNDKSQGYQRALWLYQTVDNVQGMAGWAAMANQIGENVSLLGFMSKLTPKHETTQAVDFGVKLVTELLAFTQLNGLPGDSFADFAKSLSDYQHEALMRMAALICLDGILPMGPDFLDKALSFLDKANLSKNERFQKVQSMIPGGSPDGQMSFINKGVSSVGDWIRSFVASRDLGTDKIVSSVRGFVQGIDGKLDFLAALLDVTCNYYEHTGAQSVARSLIERAVNEV